jgi:hypothetical protein
VAAHDDPCGDDDGGAGMNREPELVRLHVWTQIQVAGSAGSAA